MCFIAHGILSISLHLAKGRGARRKTLYVTLPSAWTDIDWQGYEEQEEG